VARTTVLLSAVTMPFGYAEILSPWGVEEEMQTQFKPTL
jgi:hypothetical protein